MSLESFIASHGFTYRRNHDGSYDVEIEFFNVNTGETGVDVVTISSIKNARDEFGY